MNRLTPIAALLALSPAAWSQTTASVARGAAATVNADAAIAAADAAGVQRVVVQGEAPGDFSDFSAGSTSLTKLPADLHDVAQSITVLSKSLLASQGAASLADALRNVPGITLGGAEGGQIGNNINLNGFTARTDIYLDGFRDRGQYYRDTFALDAVEVLMGPSSMLFGRGSTGGVINQVGKAPQRKGLTDVTASVTTNGMMRATIDHDQPGGETAAFRISAMAQDGAPTTRDEMKNRDFGVAPALRLGIGTPTEITLSALLQRNHDMPDYGVSPLNGRPVDVPSNTFYGYTDDRTNQEIATFSALVQRRFSPDTVLRNQIQSNRVHVDARETASQTVGTLGPDPKNPQNVIFLAAATGGFSTAPFDQLHVRLQSHDRVIDDHGVVDQTDFTTSLDTGAVHHALLVGAEIGHDTYSNQAYYRNGSCNGFDLNPAGGTSGYSSCAPLSAPVHAGTPANAPSVPGNLSASSANSYAAYIGDTASFGSQFKLVGGLRRDRFDARIANTVTKPLAVSQEAGFTSVRTGAIWAPTWAQSYYVSYSTSFNPSLEQLTNTTGTTAPLPPERNKSSAAGAKVDLLGGRLSVNAAVFQITKFDARSQNPDGTYEATGTVRVRGGRVGGAGELGKGWKVFAGYACLDADIVDAIAIGTQDKVPANTPRHSATLWTTWEMRPHWEIGGGSVYQSARYMNNTDLTSVGGYARWDGTLAYRRAAYDMRLNVFNLFDRKYYDALIQSDGGRAVPGTGRSAMLSVTYHL